MICAILIAVFAQDADAEKNAAALVQKLQSENLDEKDLAALGEAAAPAIERAASTARGGFRVRLKRQLRTLHKKE